MRIKRKYIFCCLVGLLIAQFISGGLSAAASNSIYLSPSSSNVQLGNNIIIALRINPGTAVNAVQATLQYNPSLLSFISSTPGCFSTCIHNGGGNGTITISCASLGTSASSDTLIASLVFTALVGSGSSSLTLSNVNAADNGTYTNPSSVNATVNFISPPAAVSTTPSSPIKSPIVSPTTTHNTTPLQSAPTAASPTVAAIPPSVNVTSSGVQFTQAGIRVVTNQPLQTYVAYGISPTSLILSTAPIEVPANSKSTIQLDSNSLIPGTTYYYQVVGANVSGTITKSKIESFTTKGYTLIVTVLDELDRPIAGQTVLLHSAAQYAKTDSRGRVTFTNVSPGLHHIEYKSYSEAVVVANIVQTRSTVQTAPTQNTAVIMTGYKTKGNVNIIWILVSVCAIFTLSLLLGRKHLHSIRTRLAFYSALSKHYSLSQIEEIESMVHAKSKTQAVKSKNKSTKE